METRVGILGRVGERVLGWIALGLLIFVGIAIYQMPTETKQAIWSGIWRSIVWFALIAAIPWSAKLYIRRVLEIGSNWASVALIAGLVLADIIAGLMLITGWPDGFWGWISVIGALGIAGTYNYLVTEYLAEMAGG
jgi:uncharacterized membrane protein